MSMCSQPKGLESREPLVRPSRSFVVCLFSALAASLHRQQPRPPEAQPNRLQRQEPSHHPGRESQDMIGRCGSGAAARTLAATIFVLTTVAVSSEQRLLLDALHVQRDSSIAFGSKDIGSKLPLLLDRMAGDVQDDFEEIVGRPGGGLGAILRLLFHERTTLQPDTLRRLRRPVDTDRMWRSFSLTASGARREQLQALEVLIGSRANLNAQDKTSGYTAVTLAVAYGDVQVLQMLLQAGASPDIPNPVLTDKAQGHRKVVPKLTPLGLAASRGQDNIMQLLLEAGASSATREQFLGSSPLQWAAYRGHKSALQLLISRETDTAASVIDQPLHRGASALHMFASSGALRPVKLLVEAGADLRAVDLDGLTARQAAEEGGYAELAAFLASVEADHTGTSAHRSDLLIGYGIALLTQAGVLALLARCCKPKPAGHAACDRSKQEATPAPSVWASLMSMAAYRSQSALSFAAVQAKQLEKNESIIRQQDNETEAEGGGASPPPDFVCPLTLELMSDPVRTVSGHVYERAEITCWLRTSMRDPNTNLELPTKRLTPDEDLRRAIDTWKAAQQKSC
jgi:ankyrin repeat protein